MPHDEQAKYPGGIPTNMADATSDIQAHITATHPVNSSLDSIWKQTSCASKLELLIYNAVCISKLIYGLETSMLTEAISNILDIWAMPSF